VKLGSNTHTRTHSHTHPYIHTLTHTNLISPFFPPQDVEKEDQNGVILRYSASAKKSTGEALSARIPPDVHTLPLQGVPYSEDLVVNVTAATAVGESPVTQLIIPSRDTSNFFFLHPRMFLTFVSMSKTDN
jgi:hypothetical protein